MTVQRGFRFDFNRCTGCGACVIACLNENQAFTTKAQRTQRGARGPNPQSWITTTNHTKHTKWQESETAIRLPRTEYGTQELRQECSNLKSEVRIPISEDHNSQSAIRNPQLGPSRNWRQVVTFNERRHPALPAFHLSMACNHCGDPACLTHCPAGAYRKDPATGAVTIDAERCIGCKYCTWACPYDAPRYNPERGVMEKCTLCDHRLAEGRPPACVANCPTGALGFADVDPGAGAPAAPGFTRTEIHPAVQFVHLRRGDRPPELSAPANRAGVDAVFDRTFPRLPAKITLRAEWPLVAFTSVVALLVGWLSAALLGGPPVRPAVFLGAGFAALGLSAMHLGRKERAWQSLRNLRRSWLSLEILSFPLFLGLGVLQTLLFPRWPVLGALAAAVGLTSLFIIDRVYQVALQGGRPNFHSAQVFFTGLFLAGVLSGRAWLYLPAGGVKLALYLWRKWTALDTTPGGGKHGPASGLRLAGSVLRVGLGFGVPLGIALQPDSAVSSIAALAAAAAALAGEWIDRCEFYDELDVITPRRQIQEDLEAAWRALSR
jgi:Fe-S-cluster-containing dehydrogenase component/DMSO reductase anchor subunit